MTAIKLSTYMDRIMNLTSQYPKACIVAGVSSFLGSHYLRPSSNQKNIGTGRAIAWSILNVLGTILVFYGIAQLSAKTPTLSKPSIPTPSRSTFRVPPKRIQAPKTALPKQAPKTYRKPDVIETKFYSFDALKDQLTSTQTSNITYTSGFERARLIFNPNGGIRVGFVTMGSKLAIAYESYSTQLANKVKEAAKKLGHPSMSMFSSIINGKSSFVIAADALVGITSSVRD